MATVNKRLVADASAIAMIVAKLFVEDFDLEYDCEFRNSEIWTDFVAQVKDAIDPGTSQFEGNWMFCSAEHDEWKSFVGDRMGIPLNALEERWLLLKKPTDTSTGM